MRRLYKRSRDAERKMRLMRERKDAGTNIHTGTADNDALFVSSARAESARLHFLTYRALLGGENTELARLTDELKRLKTRLSDYAPASSTLAQEIAELSGQVGTTILIATHV